MEEKKETFKINDRRSFNVDGSVKNERNIENSREDEESLRGSHAEERKEENKSLKEKKTVENQEIKEERDIDSLPPVDFSGLILSLSHATIAHLGQAPDPSSGKINVNKGLARQTIDTIAMLKEKTKGNLSSEEQRLVDNILTELRLVYVRINS